MRILVGLLLLVLAAFSVRAMAQPAAAPVTLASPDGKLTLTVSADNDGRPGYALARAGQPVLARSALGFLLTDDVKLHRQMAVTASATRSFAERWEQPWGESRYVENRYNELRVTFSEKIAPGRRFDVVFRLFDDGLGFRYEFPDQPNLKVARIADELTEFVVARPGTAWWIQGGDWNRYEYLYMRSAINAVGTAHTPITMRLEDGTHLAFHEAALVDYSGMRLMRLDGQRFRATLAPSSEGARVTRAAPFNTPWRTVRVTESAAKLYESNLELNLNEPNKLGDVSWFRPHKYVGVWWEMHLRNSTWGSGPTHGATTANTRRYIDFAAKHGFRGVLVEGWNPGWDGDWYSTGGMFDFTKAYPDFDLPGLAAYGAKKGVRLIGHHETAGNIWNYEAQLGAALDLYARHGVDSIKTGYVADGGGIIDKRADGGTAYEWHDGQRMSRHHLLVVTEAAKRKIAINPHEPIKDTGLRRTFPNWVAREGARGGEYDAWGEPKNLPFHVPTLVFTRMLAGPMDYTPGLVSLKGVDNSDLPSTVARQLALYVVVYSPIQMAADLPENYEKRADAFQFIKDVPADWAETRVLEGAVGDHAVIARKDRNSEDWYIGAVTDETAREFTLPLSFLTPGKRYTAQIYADAADADYRSDTRHKLAVTTREVRSTDSLPLTLAPGGGAAVRLKAR